jgi:hypothetical protein
VSEVSYSKKIQKIMLGWTGFFVVVAIVLLVLWYLLFVAKVFG